MKKKYFGNGSNFLVYTFHVSNLGIQANRLPYIGHFAHAKWRRNAATTNEGNRAVILFFLKLMMLAFCSHKMMLHSWKREEIFVFGCLQKKHGQQLWLHKHCVSFAISIASTKAQRHAKMVEHHQPSVVHKWNVSIGRANCYFRWRRTLPNRCASNLHIQCENF